MAKQYGEIASTHLAFIAGNRAAFWHSISAALQLMTTEVSLQPLARTPRAGDVSEKICVFEAGYADVLTPYFDRLNEQSGQLLVFVNGATFGGADLKFLERLLREVRAEIGNYGDRWQTSLGWQIEAPDAARELFATLKKARLLALLDEVAGAIARARSEGSFVRFNFWGES